MPRGPVENQIPIAECVHGTVYRIKSRNLSIGVFNSENKGFIGIRNKFGCNYLFTEYHWDTGAPFGTACPFEALEPVPAIIPIKEHLKDDADPKVLQTNMLLKKFLQELRASLPDEDGSSDDI